MCVTADGDLKDCGKLPECDAAVFGFRCLGEVNYERELKGESDKFGDAVRLSLAHGCAVVAGCRTFSRGIMRKSAAVADGGRLLGITDMTHVIDGEEYKSGASLGLYPLGGYKAGVCIENDLFFPDGFRAMSMCGCNLVVALAENLRDGMPPLLIRSYAYLYGVPVVLCAGNIAYYASVTGEIASSNGKYALFDIEPRNRYRIVTTRMRGMLSEEKTDY